VGENILSINFYNLKYIIITIRKIGELMGTKTITLKVPSNVSKKDIEKFVKGLELEKRFKKTNEFNFFVKDDKIKRKILEVAEFVENYIKKKHPKVKFEIVLDYDGIDEDIVMDVVFEKTSFEKGMEIVKDVRKRIRDKFIKLPLPITILASWGDN
jgi:hypothetical protein